MPMLYPYGIKRAKGEGENSNRQSLTPMEPAPKGIAERSEGDTIK